MMKDLECPYCNQELDVCHDDGENFDESENHEMQCKFCEKNFIFRTSIVYYYYPEKADCLNGSPHDFKPTKTFPKFLTKMRCSICGTKREITADERKEFKIETYEEYLESIEIN